MRVRCLICDTIWQPTPNNIKRGTWCPSCSFTTSQKKLLGIIKNIFKSSEVYSNYKEFGWLYFERNQEIDIFVKDKRVAIEYDGEQHFFPVNFGGISDDEAKKQFELVLIRDANKNNLVLKNRQDIEYFIRIPYYEILSDENIRDILISNGVEI
jgi:hypothetical protein